MGFPQEKQTTAANNLRNRHLKRNPTTYPLHFLREDGQTPVIPRDLSLWKVGDLGAKMREDFWAQKKTASSPESGLS